jgi:hypothetical protein
MKYDGREMRSIFGEDGTLNLSLAEITIEARKHLSALTPAR